MPCPLPLQCQTASSQARLKSCWVLPPWGRPTPSFATLVFCTMCTVKILNEVLPCLVKLQVLVTVRWHYNNPCPIQVRYTCQNKFCYCKRSKSSVLMCMKKRIRSKLILQLYLTLISDIAGKQRNPEELR